MTYDYDLITAIHYSIFRPFLHKPILNKCIASEEKYDIGLDIGCGTGQSSIALMEFCNKVIGIEPREEMLQKSIKHSKLNIRFITEKYWNLKMTVLTLLHLQGHCFTLNPKNYLMKL